MTVFREYQCQNGMAVDEVDLSNISKFLRSQVFDTLAMLARITEADPAPASGYLFAVDMSGAPVRGGGMVLSNLRGVICQVASGTVDGLDPKFIAYYVASGELDSTIAAADPTNARIDLLCVKLDHTDGASESRDFEDATTRVLTSDAAAKPTRVVRCTKALVQGTPAGSPSEPSVPSGYVKLAAVNVPAAATSLSASLITDYRIPLGLRAVDMLGSEGVAADISKWPVSNIYERTHTDAGTDAIQFFPNCGGNTGRIIAVEMVRMRSSGGGTAVAKLVRTDPAYAVLASAPSTTDLATLSDLVGGGVDTLPVLKGTVNFVLTPWWLNGYQAGVAMAFDSAYYGLKATKAGLQWTPGGGGATDRVRLVRFWVAG